MANSETKEFSYNYSKMEILKTKLFESRYKKGKIKVNNFTLILKCICIEFFSNVYKKFKEAHIIFFHILITLRENQ